MLERLTVIGSLQILATEVDGFLRGNGGIFSFYGYNFASGSYGSARGVAVCGADFYI